MGILKLGGIASGLDVDGLIKTLMTLERKPVVQLQKRSDKLTSEANAWRDLNQRLLTLQKRLQEVRDLSTSSWDGKKAAVADSAILTATTQSTATPGTYTVESVSLAKATIWQSGLMNNGAGNTPITDPAADLNLTGRIKVATGPNAGQTFDIAATDSLNDIAKTINDQKDDLGFTASVVQVNPNDYRLILTGTTGSSSHFTLEDGVMDDSSPSTAGAALKLTTGGILVETAANAQAKVNGITVTSESNTFQNAIPGASFTIAKTGSSTVTVSEDNSKVVTAVKAFVDQYNSVVDFISSATSYDSKTKATGTLFGEDRVTTIANTLREKLIDPVSAIADDFESLAVLGISTEAFTAGSKVSNKLTFDQAKFEKALDANPNAVRDLFTLNSGDDKGLAVRAVEWLDNYTKTGGILLGHATTLDKEVERVKARIKVFDEQILPMREQRLRNQFIALEKSMSTIQNQQNWLSQQVKGFASWTPQS